MNSSRLVVDGDELDDLEIPGTVWRDDFDLVAFVLADDGALALTGETGTILDRLAPGEAGWVAPGQPRAVVSLERDPVDYVAISLLPAADLPASTQDRRMTGEAPFAAPSGTAFDVDLVRDALMRDEETTIAAGSAPSLSRM